MTARVIESKSYPDKAAASLPYLGAALPVGLTGAAVVALLMLLLDAMAGHPLGTPNVLGAALLRGESIPLSAPIRPGLVFGYTLLHGAAFMAVAAAAVSAEFTLSSRGVPLRLQLVFGIAGLFGGLQGTFMILGLLLGVSGETLGIGRIALANGIAAVAMAAVVALRGHGHRGARH
jgi:hypothetical protein